MRKLSETNKKTKADNSELLENQCFETYLEFGMLPLESIKKDGMEAKENSQDETDLVMEKFDRCLLEAIDEGLSSLGEPVKNAVYQHLQNNFGIEKKNIPGQINKFSYILHKIFGLGATRLEIIFMKNLNSIIGVSIKWPEYEYPLSKWVITDLSFTEYVCEARENYGVKCKETVDFHIEVNAINGRI